jgi:hypothetical protein
MDACKKIDTKEQGNGSNLQTSIRPGQVAQSLRSFACMEYVSHPLTHSTVPLELTNLSWMRQVRSHVESHR